MSTEHKEFEYEEMEISFTRIAKQCIKKIKIIIILAVILAIAVPSIVYVKDQKDYKDAKIQEDEKIELTENDEVAVERYFFLKSRVEYFEEREELSPVMKLDFENVYEGKMIYYVDAEAGVNADIGRALLKYIGDQTFAELFAKKIGVKDFPYLNEIIRISSPEENSGVVHITVWTEKKEKCEEYMKVVNEIVMDYSRNLQSSIESHEIRLVTEEVSKKNVESVYIEQNKFYVDKKVAQEELDAWKDSSLTTEAKKAIASLELEEEDIEEDELISPSFSIKYLFLGGALGIILGVLLIFVVTIFDGRIQTENQLAKQFGLKCLGVIGLNPHARKNNESNLELLALNIKKHFEESRLKEVHFIGTLDSSTKEEIQLLRDVLVSKGVNCVIEERIIGNAEEFDKLQGALLVIVEQVGESKIKEVSSEIQMCTLLDAHVMGYICITD